MEIAPGVTRIGWIGTGIMGRYMCQHLMEAGYSATVYNRTLAKCDPLARLGATVASSPAEVAAASDVVFSIVGYPKDVREVILGEHGALGAMKEGSILVDMTTSEPSLAKEIHEAGLAKGVSTIDAPVSGGDVGAREARLSIMIGGDEGAVGSIRPLFDCMGKNVRYMGPAGSGQNTKMVNQILISTNMIGMCEALIFAKRAGLDLSAAIAAVEAGAAGSWSISNLGPRIVKGDMEPGFMVCHFLKDLGIALDEARRMGLSLPGLALSFQLYQAVQANGGAEKGTQALMLALESLNGVHKDD
jgi:3-hydroxyisobutyrate dehydrogenase